MLQVFRKCVFREKVNFCSWRDLKRDSARVAAAMRGVVTRFAGAGMLSLAFLVLAGVVTKARGRLARWFAGSALPANDRARRPRALVTTPARTRNARLSTPAPAKRVRSSPHRCCDARAVAFRSLRHEQKFTFSRNTHLRNALQRKSCYSSSLWWRDWLSGHLFFLAVGGVAACR